MNLRAAVICVVGLAIVSGGTMADDPKKDKNAKDEIAGEWRLATIVENDSGVISRIDLLGDVLHMKFVGEKVTIRSKNQNETKWKSKDNTFKLAVDQNPKQIDIVDPNKRSTMYGIYNVEGDLLTICYVSSQAKDRPSEFKADGKKVHLELYRRVND